MNPIIRKCLLSVAGLAAAGGAVAGPAAAHAAPVKGKGDRTADYEYQAQPNFFYCGPASARIALSAEGKDVSQDELAAKLGTTQNGTDSAIDITRVLNEYTGGKYRTTEIRDDVATPEQVARLRADIRTAVDDDRPVVANILGGARDIDGVEHSYPGHYLTVVRYEGDADTVLIADPARPDTPTYWMDVTELANWIAGRGYSS
ncbi:MULTISPECIES: C39 family peptidase [Micromonospora]|uniref:glutathione gamma-glutamylcysteinyltransferase n=1 Tax=Micromonospora chalcea TaxID=1874 RepID=A0ABX9Y3Y1_MICCH|nr:MULTISPECIES: C39 family peptidase [Micromonospora]MBC8988650.1 C39 family peptidase [Micromonospora chalcea]NHO80266.1 C39 family peptidase [Micromonospora sp. CMU55-4]ODB80106.1 phytochelatin synthase [Micromonospora sp. II]PPA56439.1 phytochelatin synthase [Micromonospora chalcea]RBQ13208.1 phytochelatin synthase [Micromonospora sp. LHW51205]